MRGVQTVQNDEMDVLNLPWKLELRLSVFCSMVVVLLDLEIDLQMFHLGVPTLSSLDEEFC